MSVNYRELGTKASYWYKIYKKSCGRQARKVKHIRSKLQLEDIERMFSYFIFRDKE